MKKNILANIRVLAILMACLTVLGVGNVWGATTGTIAFGNSGTKINSSSVSGNDSQSNTWTITTSGTTSYTQSTSYSQVGKSSEPATSITFTMTLGAAQRITAFSADFGGFSDTDGDVSLTVGSTEIGSGFLSSTSDVTISNDISAVGTVLTVSVTNIAKGVKCYSISYTYEAASAQTVTFNKQGGTFDDPSVFINTNQIKEQSAGAGITLPLVNPSSACASEGWGFLGWATSAVASETTTAPTIVGQAGDTYYPTSDIPLHAVFAKGEYTKITSGLDNSSKYIFVAVYSTKNYVMTSKYLSKKLKAKQIDESSSGKYNAALIDPSWCYTLEANSSSWHIVDCNSAHTNHYLDVSYADWYGHTKDTEDPYTIAYSTDHWTITSDYDKITVRWFAYSSEDGAFVRSASSQDLQIYKAGTIYYHSTPSCCDKAVTLSVGTKTNVSTIEFSETSVPTCGDQASRSVTVTVTTSSGYEMTGDLSFSKSSGTATATKSTGPTGTGPYTYVYYFDQDDNGAGSFAATASAKSYTVTLNDNNGSGGSGSKSVTFNSNTNMTSAVAIPERTHYIFGGYWTSANSGATLDTKIIDTDGTWVASVTGYTDATPKWIKADNVTLYAKWTEHTYTNYRTTCSSTYDIVLDKNGGDADGSAKVDANATKLKSISAPTKTGYKVEGYYAESGKTNLVAAVDGTLEKSVDISSTDWTDGDGKWVKGSGATLYAGWEANTYTISLDNESPTEEGSTSVTLTYDSNSHDGITNPTKTGYTFGGWYSSDNGTGELVIDASGDLQENVEVSDEGWTDASGNWIYDYEVTLYAKWTANSYTVTLDNNEATSGSQQTVSATYDAAMPLKTTADGTPAVAALSRTGYTFTGWWDATSGGTQYYSYDGSSIASANNWDKTSATTLKAQWSINSYTLTWSWGGGSTSSTTHTAAGSVVYGTTLVYPDNATMSKTGYSFNGWSSTPSTMPASNTTITAQWSINNYNLAVVTNSNVTITANTTIEEGGDDDVTYATTVTLNYDELVDGLTWGGWRVYKADDASTTVSVSGSGDGATFSMPAYDVKVEAIVYSVGIAWCEPNVTVTGDVHLTSTKDVYVHLPSTGLININSDDMGSATKMEVGYLDENEDEVDKAESPFRFCNNGTPNYNVADESAIDLDYEWGTTHSIKYTPTDYDQRHNYKLQFTFKRGDKVLKTVTHAIYGRSLPEEFVIAVQNTNDSKWYAIPSSLAETQAAQARLLLTKAIEIEVDNTTTPTKATIAPNTRVYKATGRNTPASNINGIRLNSDDSHWLQVSTSDETKLWLSNSNSDNAQVFYLKSDDFGAYTVTRDPSQGSTKKIGIYTQSTIDYIGYYASIHSNIYFLPVQTKIDELAATADDWTQHDVLVEANASSVSATKVLGVLGATTSNKETVPAPVAENTYLLKLDGDLDYVDKDGQTLQLKWYDSSDELKAYSWVTVPSIITAGTKTTWTALEDSLTTSTTLNDIVVLSKPMTIDDTHAKAKQIVIDQNSNTCKLTIQPSKGLEVASTVKVYNGTNFVATGEADLVLESSSSEGNASLIFDNSNACQATVQMYSKAAIVGDTWKWQYVGTPFTGSIPGYNYYGSWMYKWDKTDGWLVVHGGDELTPFAGYCLTQESATTHVMGGTLVATDGNDIEIDMAASTDMVIANSWTAPIWIGGFTAETFTSEPATIYMFNTGSAENGSSAGTAEAGTYEAIPINSAPFIGDGLIPSMQGFFVTTQPEGGSGKAGTITLKYDELVRPKNDRDGVDPNIITTGPMYAPKRVNKPEVMKIMANGSKYSDRVVLLERADFSSGFDNGWDGEKLSFGVEGPSVYVINGQGKYDAVSAIPTFEGTVVGFRSGTDNSCTISFEYDGNETLYLNDLKMQQSTPIDTVHTYTFSTASSDNEARFIISATPITAVTTGFESSAVSGQSSEVRKVLIGSQIYIIRGGRMFSTEGQMVK